MDGTKEVPEWMECPAHKVVVCNELLDDLKLFETASPLRSPVGNDSNSTKYSLRKIDRPYKPP